MTSKDLEKTVDSIRATAANLLKTTLHAKSMTFEIREIPLAVLREYAVSNGELLDAVNSAGYVECRTSKACGYGGVIYVNLLSKKQVVFLEEN